MESFIMGFAAGFFAGVLVAVGVFLEREWLRRREVDDVIEKMQHTTRRLAEDRIREE